MSLPDIFQKYYWKEPGPLPCDCLSSRAKSVIEGTYGARILWSACQPAPSLAVRDEHLLVGNDRGRFAHRTHIFEEQGTPAGGVGEHIGCLNARLPNPDDAGDRIGIAEAFLKPPRRMLTPQYTMPLLSPLYTPFFGLLPYICIPYSSVASSVGGFCAQTSVYMCLLTSVRHGGVARGPFTLTCQAKYWRRKASGEDRPEINRDGLLPDKPMCVDKECHDNTAFEITGLNDNDIAELLNRSDVKPRPTEPLCASAYPVRRNSTDALYQVIYSYVCSGVPVIAVVNPSPLWDEPKRPSTEAHAVVIIGTRGRPWQPEWFSIVYHDPSVGPYREARAGVFQHAVATTRRPYLIPVLPGNVKVTMESLFRCVRRMPVGDLDIPQHPRFWTVRLVQGGNADGLLPDWASNDLALQINAMLAEHISDVPEYMWAFEKFKTKAQAISHSPAECLFFDATGRSPDSSLAFRYTALDQHKIELYGFDKDTCRHLGTAQEFAVMIPR